MYDWNEADKVEDTLWDDFKKKEGHNMPYPKSGGDDTFMIGDYWNKQDNEQKNTGVSSTKESASGSKNGLPGCNLNSSSNFHMKKSLACSNFSSVSNAIEKEGGFRNKHHSISSAIVNDFKDTFCSSHERNSILTELCQSGDILDSNNPSSYKETYGFPIDGREELDGKPSVFSSEHDHDVVDSFLDCDWGSITEFDDLDSIFSCRNSDSIFGHEMMKDIDELFSPADSSHTETPLLPMHETSINMDVSIEKGSSSFQVKRKTSKDDKETSINMDMPIGKGSDSFEETEKPQVKQKTSKDDEMAGHNVVGKQAECQTDAQESKNMDREKTASKSRRKMEEKTAIKSHKVKSMPSYNGHVQVQQFVKYVPVPSALQSFQPSMFPQQGQIGGPDYVGYFPSTHHPFTRYGYPAFPFSSFPLPPHVHAARKQPQPAPVYHPYVQYQASNVNSLQNPDSTRMPKMTPQEKIEKLRRRQQMQAMLAIKQQEKHFAKQVTDPDGLLTQKMLNMNQSQSSILSATGKTEERINIPVEQEDSYSITVASDDHALQERVFREFQETIMKLDENIRQCMKESLYRLARNAKERRSASDRNIRNEDGVFKNETRILQDRSSSAATDMETDTNPIDRILAHLLFHSPSASSTEMVNEKMPLSSVPHNLEPKHYNTWESVSEEKAENVGKMKDNVPLLSVK